MDKELEKVLKTVLCGRCISYQGGYCKSPHETKCSTMNEAVSQIKSLAKECIKYDKNKYRCMPSIEKLVKEFEKRIEEKFK